MVRMNRRMYGFFRKRLDEAGLDQVRDARDDRGKRWDLGALLRTLVGAMLAGAKGLADVEELSERMSTPIKRLFGIQRRVPDTTLRDALCTVEPDELRSCLHTLCTKPSAEKRSSPPCCPSGSFRSMAKRSAFLPLMTGTLSARLRAKTGRSSVSCVA